MKNKLTLLTLLTFLTPLTPLTLHAQLRDIDNILPELQRAEIVNEWLDWRLDNIVPELMHREGIDMWIIMCRETNEDPLIWSMLPEPLMHARRLTTLIFYDPGEGKAVERYSGSGNLGGGYKGTWTDKSISQWESLGQLVKKLDPEKIGINVSGVHRSADGLSASLRDSLTDALGPKYSKRFVSAENLSIGWLETRSYQELVFYRHLCGIAHDLIREFFSNGVIVPGITTTDDVEWWIRDRITMLGLETWFPPTIDLQRSPEMAEKYRDHASVIMPGDLLHCDVGVRYLRLCSDMQWHAYVLKPGESDAPTGLQHALQNAIRVADIYMGEFKEGVNGHQIAERTHQKAEAEGLHLTLYSHPIGYYGHSAGTSIDTRSASQLPPGMIEIMNWPLHLNTVYAIEFGCYTEVPEWNNKRVAISYEEQGVMTAEGCKWVDGNQGELILIR